MSDRVYLSVWLEEYTIAELLSAWLKALAEFPVSSLSPGIRQLSVIPFQWGEAPALERAFSEGAAVGEAAALAAEFLHDDYAYEVELNWDVWMPREPGSLDQWEKLAQSVSVACLGPEFEDEDTEEQPQLLLDLGLDSIFLPESIEPALSEELLEGVAGNCYRENIAQLLGYVRKLETVLPVSRRLLWSSSGEDLADRIHAAFGS